MFKKTKVASAVAAAIGTSLGSVGAAQAHWASSIMFPTVVASPTITTVVSVINDGDGMEEKGSGDQVLHYSYWHKELQKDESVADFNTKECAERNRYLPTSKFDIQTFDVSGKFFGGSNGVMFNDPSNDADAKASWVFYNASDDNLAQRAVLFVDNYKGQGFAKYGDGQLAGEAVVFEVDLGAAWGYQAFANSKRVKGGRGERPDGHGEEWLGNYAWAASGARSQVPFMPPAEVTTVFLVTPVAAYPHVYPPFVPELPDNYFDQLESQGQLTASIKTLGEDWFTSGVFDRDENFFSNNAKQDVQCVGGWNITDLFPDSEANDGGWTHIATYNEFKVQNTENGVTGTDKSYPAAIVFKVEYGDVTKLDGANNRVEGGGLWNNGLYLHPDRHYDPKSNFEAVLIDETNSADSSDDSADDAAPAAE
jgi:hypothetical protein